MENITIFGAEVCETDKRIKQILLVVEMYYWRRICCHSRPERTRKQAIRNKTEVDKRIFDEVEKIEMIWYGYLMRMEQGWPKRVLRDKCDGDDQGVNGNKI